MFPLSKGRVTKQAHVGLPDGTFEEEHGRADRKRPRELEALALKESEILSSPVGEMCQRTLVEHFERHVVSR